MGKAFVNISWANRELFAGCFVYVGESKIIKTPINRSPAVKPIVLMDRLGGGDAWNGGFYYGLLTEGMNRQGIEKGLLVGDAASRIKQTIMFDLPIVTKAEVQALMQADVLGGGKRTSR